MYFLACDTSSVIINEILVNAVVINIKWLNNSEMAFSVFGKHSIAFLEHRWGISDRMALSLKEEEIFTSGLELTEASLDSL